MSEEVRSSDDPAVPELLTKRRFDWVALVLGVMFVVVGALALGAPSRIDVGLLVAFGCVALGGAVALNAWRK